MIAEGCIIMNVEKTEIWITCKRPLECDGTAAVRGFFGNLYRNKS